MKTSGRILIAAGALVLTASLATVVALSLPVASSASAAQAISAAEPAPVQDPAPAPRVVEVREAVEETPAPDFTAAVALTTVNRAFGDALYDDNALIDSVEITLLDQALEIDGFRYLERSVVQDAVRRRYGREVSPEAGAIFGMEPPEGYYAILPRSYDYQEQTVTGIEERPDGTLLVTSQLLILGLDDSAVRRVETVLSPAENDYGYIITAATILE